jgi:hypothetical protein
MRATPSSKPGRPLGWARSAAHSQSIVSAAFGRQAGGQDVAGRTGGDHAAVVQEPVAHGGGCGEVVQGDQGRAVPAAQQGEEFDLVTYVEVVGRLVQDQDVRPLGERAGEQNALPLSAGQFREAASVRGRVVRGSVVAEFDQNPEVVRVCSDRRARLAHHLAAPTAMCAEAVAR